MKKTLRIFALLCVLFVSVCNVYLSATTKENFVDLMLENVDSAMAAGESGGSMHGRPLLYNADFGYKCGSCTGDDCGAVC